MRIWPCDVSTSGLPARVRGRSGLRAYRGAIPVRSPTTPPTRRGDDSEYTRANEAKAGPSRPAWGRGGLTEPRVRVAGACRLRLARADLRDHRHPRDQAGARRRGQGDEPAGSPEGDRAAAVRRVPADPRRDRPRGLRTLAAGPRRDRARPGELRLDLRSTRRARERRRLCHPVRGRCRDPARLRRQQLPEHAQDDRGCVRLAGAAPGSSGSSARS